MSHIMRVRLVTLFPSVLMIDDLLTKLKRYETFMGMGLHLIKLLRFSLKFHSRENFCKNTFMLPRINKLPKNFIPLSPPYITVDEERVLSNVLRSGILGLGPYLEKFEKKVARYVGTKFAVATSSGTAGLHLALVASGIKAGGEVITSPFSFVASANVILYVGAKPIFVDIDPETLNIDPLKIESAITKDTKAILPVHIFGYPIDYDAIFPIDKKYKLKIVEDACESLGASYRGKKVGSFGNISVFAFYPNKQITTGEGGI